MNRFRTLIRAICIAAALTTAYIAATLGVALLFMLPAVVWLGLSRPANDIPLAVNSAIALAFAALLVTHKFLRSQEDTPLTSAGLPLASRSGRDWLIGFALGWLALGLIVLSALAGNAARVVTVVNVSAGAGIAALWIGFFAIQSLGEELICRGYLLRLWTRRMNLPTGLLVSSSVFALAHVSNEAASGLALFNTLLSGILLGLVFYTTRSLWIAGGVHAGWNVAQPMLGLNVSGFAVRLTGYEARIEVGSWWDGGQYGLEASPAVTALLVVLVLCCGFAVRVNRTKAKFAEFLSQSQPSPMFPPNSQLPAAPAPPDA